MVSAPTPSRFFISRWIASLGASTALSRSPVIVRRVSSPCVAKSRLVATSMQPFTRRSGSRPSRSRMRAGKSESTCLSRLNFIERGERDIVFLAEPAQHILLGPHQRAILAGGLAGDDLGVDGRGEPFGRHHAVEQLAQRRRFCFGDNHVEPLRNRATLLDWAGSMTRP